MTIYEIPTSPEAQSFTIELAGITYGINLYFCEPAAAWVIDLTSQDGTQILSCVPLVTGVDLFEQYPYLNLGGKLFALTDNDPDAPPTFADLGTTGHLRFETT